MNRARGPIVVAGPAFRNRRPPQRYTKASRNDGRARERWGDRERCGPMETINYHGFGRAPSARDIFAAREDKTGRPTATAPSLRVLDAAVWTDLVGPRADFGGARRLANGAPVREPAQRHRRAAAPDAPSFKAIDEMRSRMPGLQFLGVLVDAGPEAGVERMQPPTASSTIWGGRSWYPPSMVGGVRVDFAAERAFIERPAPIGCRPRRTCNHPETHRGRLHTSTARLPAPARRSGRANVARLHGYRKALLAARRPEPAGERFSSAGWAVTVADRGGRLFDTSARTHPLIGRVQET